MNGSTDQGFKDEKRQGSSLPDFETIFRTLYPRLCYHSYRIVGEKETAADIVQDAFINYWDKRDDFEHELEVKAYLYISVRNASLNLIRHQKVRFRYEQYQKKTGEAESFEFSEVVRAEVLGEVYKAIEELPAKAREIFNLGYLKGLKNQEIADHLGISINTVKTQKARALELLRFKISPETFLLMLLISDSTW